MLETKISDLTKAIDALTATLEAQSLSRANIKEATQEQIDAVLGVVSAPKTDPKAEPESADIDFGRNSRGDARNCNDRHRRIDSDGPQGVAQRPRRRDQSKAGRDRRTAH